MVDHTKKQKRLSQRCPECGGVLESFSKTHDDNGVAYEEQVIECSDCDYTEKVKVSPKRCKDLYNPKW